MGNAGHVTSTKCPASHKHHVEDMLNNVAEALNTGEEPGIPLRLDVQAFTYAGIG